MKGKLRRSNSVLVCMRLIRTLVADMCSVHAADDQKWEVYCGKEERRIREGL
jgi:hypothetical protein